MYFIFRYNLMLDCWKMNPVTRPSFTDLAEFLGDLLEDGTKSVSRDFYICVRVCGYFKN